MLLRRFARPLFASSFVQQGVDAVRHPAAHVEIARRALERVTATVPRGRVAALDRYREPTPGQLTTLVRVHGAATALAGLTFALGRAPRTSALLLAALTAPLAVADLPAKKGARAGGPDAGRERSAHLLRTLSATGGALLAAADYAGRPGVSWRLARFRDDHAHVPASIAAKVPGRD
ncbi:DoxX family protein [Cellulomonas sp. 179-A 4D5 NHS]|uniref:DoxX family protein n=1 Tax=Cellulomonas sp. 179-A 4D5 NHS TaxID=3142378 RepID=UPI0039A082EB